MIRFIHLERRFEKELEALWKRGETAAHKANELLAALALKRPSRPKESLEIDRLGREAG